jgi:opacity protein-like surface antigen
VDILTRDNLQFQIRRLSFVPEKVTTIRKQQQMSKKWFVFAVAAILSGSAFAAENESGGATPNLEKGTKALEGAAAINVMGDDVQFQVAYGQFVADALEVALVGGLRDDDRYMSTELGVRAEYNFVRDSAFVPFVSAGLAWADVEVDERNLNTDAAVFSVGGGGKYFIRDNVALALSGSYLVATDDIFFDSEDGDLQGDEIRFLFSVRFYFD